MPDGLAFTLYAPLAAMGDLTVGEKRSGFDRPARSAILGLVAAALGIDRRDEAAHAALDRAYGVAQRVILGGTLVTDYHTVQAPPAERKARWATRKEALDRPSHKLNTLLSSRDYRTDLWVDVALIRLRREDGAPSPAEIAGALRRPAYTLHFGRKSCPLGRPPAPKTEDSVTGVRPLLDSLEQPIPLRDDEEDAFAPLRRDRRWVTLSDGTGFCDAMLYADVALAGDERHGLPDLLVPDFKPLRVERRRDRVASRTRWQFAMRDEIVAHPVPRENAA